MLLTALFIAGILFTAIVGVIVLVSNHNNKANQTLALITSALIIWELANYLADRSGSFTLWWNRATFIGPLFAFLFSNIFVDTIANNKKTSRNKIYLVVTACVALFCLTGSVISAIEPRLAGGELVGYNVSRGTGYFLVIFWLLILMFRFLRNLISSYRASRGRVRQQFRLVIAGVGVAVVLGVSSNVLLPLITENTASAQFAPLAGIAFTGFLAAAIIRHGLFNVRILVVRALGYALSIVVISSIYGFIMFGLAKYVFSLDISVDAQIALSVATGVAALTFQRLKTFFDNASKRFFYQDAYDTEVLFDAYNKALVSTIDLDLMVKRSSNVVVQFLKAEYCYARINESADSTRYYTVGEGSKKASLEDTKALLRLLPAIHQSIVAVDNIASETGVPLSVLQKNNVSVVIRLTSSVKSDKEELGHLVLGPKKSGNPYTNQDIKVLESLANELTIALQNALRFEEIERFNETLQEEVESATRKLKVTNRKLKKLNDAKDDFIGMASHQLRTPLTSAKGYISLVLDGDAGTVNKNQRELLEQAFASSQRMVYLIADLLNVSRIKSNKFTIERVPTHLPQLVHDEMDQLKKAVAAHDIELIFDAPKRFPTLMIDATKTRQVVMNFLDNALYYTPNGGHIRVELKELPKSVEFRVIDDGIGVPKEERHNLFTKFYRAKNAQRARPDGTGLGLYMARKVITTQGGAIIFDSKEGKGSTFGFSFPKDLPANSPTIPELATAEK